MVAIAQLTGWGQNPGRSRDFCPPLRTDWCVICAITKSPCRLAFVPHFICVILFIFQAWQFSIKAKECIYLGDRQHPLNYTCRHCDATIVTCYVLIVPVTTRAPNITNISCWKIAPKPLVYIDPKSDWISMHLYRVKQCKAFFKFWCIPKFRYLLYHKVAHLRYYDCVSASPII